MSGLLLGLALLTPALAAPEEPGAPALEQGVVPAAPAAPDPVGPVLGTTGRRALVLGANDGGTLLTPLVYAEEDAARVAKVLTELGGFVPDDVTRLETPTVAQVRAALAALAADPPTGLFLFYYSGHADARGLQLRDEVLPYEELKAAIRAIPSDVRLGIVDACRSGAITTVKGASVEAPFLLDTPEATGEAWIAASSEDEDAQESDLLQGSFFTYYLVSGLRGAADTGDGWVSLAEAYSYAHERTVARTAGTLAGPQHPAYHYEIRGNGDLRLTEVRRANARVVLPEASSGSITVLRLPERTPVAEVAKLEGRRVDLALEPGRYLLRRRHEGALQEVTVALASGGQVTVDRWGTATDPEVAATKGLAVTEEDGRRYVKIPVGFDPDNLPMPRFDWMKRSPAIAGLASALLPGAGQAYQGRWGDGLLFLSSVALLNGMGWSFAEEARGLRGSPLPGPNLFTWLGAATYLWNVADATWGVHKREAFRPRTGVLISGESSWSHSLWEPELIGIAVEVQPTPGVILGTDAVGAYRTGDTLHATYGARLAFGPELPRTRPELVLAAGVHSEIPLPDSAPPPGYEVVPSTGRQIAVQPYSAAGVGLRWYLTPRYYLRAEGRLETSDLVRFEPQLHGGMGFHLGGRVERRSVPGPGGTAPLSTPHDDDPAVELSSEPVPAEDPAPAPAASEAPAPAEEPQPTEAPGADAPADPAIEGVSPTSPTDVPE